MIRLLEQTEDEVTFHSLKWMVIFACALYTNELMMSIFNYNKCAVRWIDKKRIC